MAWYRCTPGSGGQSAPEISGQFGNTSNGLKINNGRFLSGFNAINPAYYPLNSSGAFPTFDFTKSFKYHLRFTINTVPASGNISVMGPNNNWRDIPLLRVSSSSIFASFSTDGTTTTNVFLTIPIVQGTTYDVEGEWANNVFTLKATDGVNEVTNTLSTAHHYQGNAYLQLGDIATDTQTTAKELTFDLAACWWEQDGVLLWGNKA